MGLRGGEGGGGGGGGEGIEGEGEGRWREGLKREGGGRERREERRVGGGGEEGRERKEGRERRKGKKRGGKERRRMEGGLKGKGMGVGDATFVGAEADGADVLSATVDEANKGVHVGLAAVAADGSARTVVDKLEHILGSGGGHSHGMLRGQLQTHANTVSRVSQYSVYSHCARAQTHTHTHTHTTHTCIY